jgi:hypothetical protein
MPPGLMQVRPASVDIDVRYVNVGPRVINPAVAVPAVIDDVVVIPVEVHGQPAPDGETKPKGNERPDSCGRSLYIHNRRVVLGDVDILGLGRDDLDGVTLGNDRLFIVVDQIPDGPRPPPEALDRPGHVFRLVEEGIPQVGSPIHIPAHHEQNVWVVGHCFHGLVPVLLVDPGRIPAACQPRRRIGYFFRIGRGRQDLSEQRVRVERNRSQQVIELLVGK